VPEDGPTSHGNEPKASERGWVCGTIFETGSFRTPPEQLFPVEPVFSANAGRALNQSDLKQIPAENHAATEVRLRGFDPHSIGNLRIIRRHEMGEDERLDTGILRDAAGVFD
jgi:hypothetical protein